MPAGTSSEPAVWPILDASSALVAVVDSRVVRVWGTGAGYAPSPATARSHRGRSSLTQVLDRPLAHALHPFGERRDVGAVVGHGAVAVAVAHALQDAPDAPAGERQVEAEIGQIDARLLRVQLGDL